MNKNLGIIVLVTVSAILNAGKKDTELIFKRTSPAIVNQLYQGLKDMHEIFIAKQIPYWIEFGTLLGSVRHRGLIPWEDDADVCIDLSDKAKLLALEPLFLNLGYSLEKNDWGCRLYVGEWRKNFGQIDIIYTERRDNRRYCFGLPNDKRDGELYYITQDELYPLKSYIFGDLKLIGPNKALLCLIVHYGPECLTTARMLVNHGKWAKETVVLSDRNKVPALPERSLENRVIRLLNEQEKQDLLNWQIPSS